MTRLRACYQNQIADQGQWLASIATYWEACRHYDANAVRRGFVSAWRVHPKWFPSLGQLIELVESPDAVEGSTRLLALDAWQQVVSYASGSLRSLDDDVAAEAVRLMGGRGRLARWDAQEFAVWARKEFVDLYATLVSRRAAQSALGAASEPKRLQARAVECIQLVSNAASLPQ